MVHCPCSGPRARSRFLCFHRLARTRPCRQSAGKFRERQLPHGLAATGERARAESRRFRSASHGRLARGEIRAPRSSRHLARIGKQGRAARRRSRRQGPDGDAVRQRRGFRRSRAQTRSFRHGRRSVELARFTCRPARRFGPGHRRSAPGCSNDGKTRSSTGTRPPAGPTPRPRAPQLRKACVRGSSGPAGSGPHHRRIAGQRTFRGGLGLGAGVGRRRQPNQKKMGRGWHEERCTIESCAASRGRVPCAQRRRIGQRNADPSAARL